MKNLRFLFKCILALLPLILVVLFTFMYPYGYMDKEYPAWKYTKDMAESAKDYSLSIIGSKDGPTSVYVKDTSIVPATLILGDSRAMADLIPEMFETPTKNLAVGGATSIEMYYTLENYIKNNPCPNNVVVMFAPFHYTIIDNFWIRTAYFNYLSVPQMSELYTYAKAAESETLLRKGYQNDLLSYRLRFPDKYLPALMNSHFIGRNMENTNEYEKIASNFGYSEFGTADGCSDLNYETSYDRMHTTGDAVLLDIYFNKLLSLLEENNINTTLAIPPMNESSYNALNPSYVEEITEYLKDIQTKHPGITVDYKIPMYEDTYFGDSSHLNNLGAKKFTEEFTAK